MLLSGLAIVELEPVGRAISMFFTGQTDDRWTDGQNQFPASHKHQQGKQFTQLLDG